MHTVLAVTIRTELYVGVGHGTPRAVPFHLSIRLTRLARRIVDAGCAQVCTHAHIAYFVSG